MKIITKTCISIFSFIFFLALLEGGLRIAGYFYSKNVLLGQGTFPGVERPRKILCIGDSYTVGGYGIMKDSYPMLLQEMLSKNTKKKFDVVNGGICELNSMDAFDRLNSLVNVIKPDHVILLVGAANRFNYHSYFQHSIYHLKIFKMFRILVTNFKGEFLKWQLRHRTLKNSNQIEEYILLGRYYERQQRFEEAENVYEKAMGISPSQREVYFELGRFYGEQGRVDVTNAREMYYEEQRRLEKAEGMYNKAVELNPDQSEAYFRLGRFYEKRGQIKEAEEKYKKVIELNPGKGEGYHELGRYYENQGKFQEAEEMYRKAIELSPDRSSAYLNLGRIYGKQRRFQEGEKMYRRAIELDPSQGEVYFELGEFFIEQGKYDSAVESFCKGIELNPRYNKKLWARGFEFINPDYFYLLARAYELQSKFDSDYIIKTFQKVIKNYPDLRENNSFMHYVSFFKDKAKLEKRIDKWLREDLEKMVKLCQKNGIKLIVQNYPYPYPFANKALRDLALRHSLPFVDNYLVFDELASKYLYGRYFVDHGHCTPEGHKVMAQNVYNVLVAEGIVPGDGEAWKDEKVAF